MVVMIAMISMKDYKKLTKKASQLKSNKKFLKITITARRQVKINLKVNKK